VLSLLLQSRNQPLSQQRQQLQTLELSRLFLPRHRERKRKRKRKKKTQWLLS
jgi:hypothetical protein